MFTTLLESKRLRQKNFFSNVVSGAFHALIVVGAVYATAKGAEPPEEIVEDAVYTAVKPTEPPPPVETREVVEAVKDAMPPLKGFETLTSPIEIPTVIPDIDLTQRVTDASRFDPVGIRGGDPNGVIRPRQAADTGTKFMFEVEKVARMMPGNPEPNYPSILKQTRQAGNVKVAFVIDTTGKADMSTLRIVESSHALFSESVQKVLSRYRFIPAEIGGNKVRMHVELPFIFALEPKGGG